jgi:pSer/pThr/pTyr-binding forkhead associated (FHA) protein
MPKIIVSTDGVVIKEVQLTKDRTSMGRRPYNDIVIDNLAVSGEHAVLQMSGNEVYLEDLNSTNGTYVNGKAVKKKLLKASDSVEIGKYTIKIVDDEGTETAPLNARAGDSYAYVPAADLGMGLQFAIKVLSGAAAGREVVLVKVVTTIGKPGVAVAAITKRPQGFVLAHVEGAGKLTLNGAMVGTEPALLKNGDLFELAGTQMEFVQR